MVSPEHLQGSRTSIALKAQLAFEMHLLKYILKRLRGTCTGSCLTYLWRRLLRPPAYLADINSLDLDHACCVGENVAQSTFVQRTSRRTLSHTDTIRLKPRRGEITEEADADNESLSSSTNSESQLMLTCLGFSLCCLERVEPTHPLFLDANNATIDHAQ